MTRKGDWMQTATGRQFWPLDPRADEVFIEDIAHALSLLCRYGGHCLRFYSVAEHCVLLANTAPLGLARAALLHDASEAYLSDVIRPVKRHLGNYIEIEQSIERVIADRFALEWPTPPFVKRMDDAILADECAQAMTKPPADWCLPQPPLGVTLQFWSPERAKVEFLAAFQRYR
jgi:uncharacterized protein